ncbi:CBN-NHR-277 protein [Caenorhabditis brenneri]|uniref:CBN-NHR-277 protein n=1 Tax=Caenorhabditis brenneri TaxID=135651 RepID=G0MZS9_CAEBE|nr:CBN-NHR-277 protein [Caenorhabditis brenneri]
MLLHKYPTTTDHHLLNSTPNFYSSNSPPFEFAIPVTVTKFEPMFQENDSPDGSPDSDPGPSVVGRLQMPSITPKIKLCEVCGNAGATSHYGGTVCGGCKIFFSRTVQSRKGFVCERGGQCPMNAGKRAKCRACRFQLCLKAHMSPEEVGRLRDMRMGDYTPMVKKEGCIVGYFDESSQPSTSLQDCANQIISFIDVYNYGNNEIGVLNMLVNIERNFENNGLNRVIGSFPKECRANMALLNAIGFPIPICDRIPMDYVRKIFLEDPKTNMKLFWCRNVRHFLEWANANDDLGHFSRKEKTLLIAENFISISCLTSFFGFLKIQREEFERSSEDDKVHPPCSPEWFSEISDLNPEVKISIHRAISEIMEPMDSLDITLEEIILLKYIMLFNEPSRTSDDIDIYRIRCYRLKYCELLRKYIKKQIPDPEKRLARLSELIKIMESVKNTSMYLDKWMTIFHTANTCEMNELLVYDFHVRTWNDVDKSKFYPMSPPPVSPWACSNTPPDGMMAFRSIKREI